MIGGHSATKYLSGPQRKCSAEVVVDRNTWCRVRAASRRVRSVLDPHAAV